jgi:hypothetical protein
MKNRKGLRRRRDCNHILYRLDCTVTGEFYIGLSAVIRGRAIKRTLTERFRRHYSKAIHESRTWTLHKRLRRYGPQKWQKQVLAVVRGRDVAFSEERRLIRKLAPSLNTF